jgi:hypothetical protein
MGVTRHLAFRGLADFLLEAIDGQRGNQEREIGARCLTRSHRTTRPNDESRAAAGTPDRTPVCDPADRAARQIDG